MHLARRLVAAILSLTAGACAPTPADLPTEDAADDVESLAEGTHFLVTRQDNRKCMSPLCGGVFVKAANRQKTTCFDGTKQLECYVGAIDLSALGLGGLQEQTLRDRALSQEVLFTGDLEVLQGDIAKLVVSELRASLDDEDAVGTYYLVESTGVRCASAPCPLFRARNLNSTSVKELTDLDTAALALDESQWAGLSDELYSGGLVMAGVIKTKGKSKTLHASQAFPLVQPEPDPAPELCLTDDVCGEGRHCDHSECLSNCPPEMICPTVCYGACADGEPAPPAAASCVDRCGGASVDESCWCDADCADYGDCCADYVATCGG
jgi:hypothetical protein